MKIQQHIIKVGMADINVVADSGVLKTTGLGSCVGLSLYDSFNKIAGMAHIMLPSSDIARIDSLNTAKYADTAIPELIARMKQLGVNKNRLEAKIAGGAQMFVFSQQTDTMRIGPRNVEACTEILNQLSIPIVASDTGGNYGRTIEFYSDSGKLVVRSVQRGVKEF